MKNLILFLISPILLLISVVFSHFSGNDKAPFFILLALVIIGLIFIVTGLIGLFTALKAFKFLCLGSALTLVYVIIVISFSRIGILDSNIWLGFR